MCIATHVLDGANILDPSRFATKTAYRHCSLSSFDDGTLKQLDACTLVHVNVLHRHGTRVPGHEELDKFKQLYTRLVSSPGVILPPGFEELPIPFANASALDLLPRGYKELYDLGRALRNRLPDWFSHRPNIKLFSSSSQRTIDSAVAFYRGLFNLSSMEAIEPRKTDDTLREVPEDIQIADHLLRFFDYCPRYREEIKENKTAMREVRKFQNGEEIQQVFAEVSLKHRLPNSNFSAGDMYYIFLMCAYATAISDDQSPWCGFLRKQHQPVFEYLVELKHYWSTFDGYELNYIQSCPLVAEMLGQIHEAALDFKKSNYNISNPALHRATFWFAHTETLLPVIAILGLFNDSLGKDHFDKLYADQFEKWLKKTEIRPPLPNMFRSGYLAPFAGNLALELYYCPESVLSLEDSDPLAGFIVVPRVNNQTVAWPMASTEPVTPESPGGVFAPLSTVLNKLNGCMPGWYDQDKVCALRQDLTVH